MRRAGAWSPRLSSYYCLGVLLFREDLISAAAAVYQIPNTEHMAYRLVRLISEQYFLFFSIHRVPCSLRPPGFIKFKGK